MGKLALVIDRRLFQRLLLHMGGFLLVFVTALWLRQLTPKPDPILQGYLQITTGLFAFVFAAVALVRFQGTQDRVSLILGSGFLLSGATLTSKFSAKSAPPVICSDCVRVCPATSSLACGNGTPIPTLPSGKVIAPPFG